MKMNDQASASLTNALARILSYGVWCASFIIALGLFMPALGFGSHALQTRLMITGISLLVCLPILRVAVMGAWFLARRDFQFALIAAAVLAIIGLSIRIGLTAA